MCAAPPVWTTTATYWSCSRCGCGGRASLFTAVQLADAYLPTITAIVMQCAIMVSCAACRCCSHPTWQNDGIEICAILRSLLEEAYRTANPMGNMAIEAVMPPILDRRPTALFAVAVALQCTHEPAACMPRRSPGYLFITARLHSPRPAAVALAGLHADTAGACIRRPRHCGHQQ